MSHTPAAMVETSVVLHANLLYAEIPMGEIPRLVEDCYLPVLRILAEQRGIRIGLNASGFTLELLAGEHPGLYRGDPEAVSLLRQALGRRQVEMTGTSWAHAILPLLPPPLIAADLRLGRSAVERVLGYEPAGFFPPEMAICPLLPELLLDSGYSWSFVDADFPGLTEDGALNAFDDFSPVPPSLSKLTARAKFQGPLSRLRHLRRIEKRLRGSPTSSPVLWTGTRGRQITALGCDSAWLSYSLMCLSRTALLDERRLLATIEAAASRAADAGAGRGLLLPYCSDIEFFGHGGNTIKEPVPVSRLGDFLKALAAHPGLKMTLPSEFLARVGEPSKRTYLKSGSWSTDRDFALWECEPDNALLNRLSGHAYDLYRRSKGGLQPDEDEALLKDLLLSYNSDGRGWTPLAEHRLFCMDRALAVQSRLGG